MTPPVVDDINESDTVIKGEGIPGDTITVTTPDGDTLDTIVKEDGTWGT